ncbi:MAG: sensor histidine kinase [Aquincola tertiaricarbonis]
MYWKKTRRLTLKATVLALLLPGLAGIIAVELSLTRADALEAANAAYDRSLLGAIRSLDLNVSTASGGLSVELPYRLFEFFQLTARGDVYFRVATADGLVEIGSPDLPKPPALPAIGTPVFYDATYLGDAVRVGTYVRLLEQPLSSTGVRELVIQVAENLANRREFIRSFMWRATLRDGSLIALVGLGLAGLMAWAMRPLSVLAAQVAGRSDADLRPLESRGLPADVQPLVEAVNRQMARTQAVLQRERAFLDDASHQLRTPLATLRAQIDYGLRETDPQQWRHTLQALSQQLDDAVRSTHQLLAMARSDTVALQPAAFDLGDFLRTVALKLLPQARARSLDFGVEPPAAGTPVQARGDATLLGEAFGNLVHNAIVHSPAQGKVTLGAAADGFGCSLWVRDEGPGLDAAVQPRIGQRFVKGRGSNGAGLGLAIARNIAERHGGTLVLEPAGDGPGLLARLWWPSAGLPADGSSA